MAEPRTVTLPPRTWAILACGAAALTAIFAAQLVLLVQQKALIDHQESIAERQAAHSLPLLRTADALLGDGSALRAGARTAGRAAADVRRADLPTLSAAVADLLPELRRLPELVDLQRRAVDTLGRSYVTQRRSLARLEASLDVQRRTLATAEQTLAVARETLGHTRSIDAKTGGSAPASVLPVP